MPLNFQQVILTLQQFWAERGALLWQPYYTQVGAGTMNPATFLRVLGPEPWNVAYVEPSVRPDDGRYGENPNRFQLHYQFQVILKPDPGNPQEIYLDSLKAIGIDPRQHDIRFVEDNWEQPAISAWGLGWEVWLDGQEITQFTYFQQVGGVTLDPVAVEITYGLERILIGLHNVKAAWDLPWNESITYGDVRRQEEFEHSKYYYEVGNIESMKEIFERFEAESKAALEQGLVVPAYDYVLKCNQTFNILDARGAVGVTERQAYFRRMRELARRVGEVYLKQRQALEYPLMKQTMDDRPQTILTSGAKIAASSSSTVHGPTSFLLEIGTEELPPADVDTALSQLRERVSALLKDLSLEHGSVTIDGTPRRLVVSIEDLSPNQPDREDLVKGPPADKAFDASGIALPAAMGFAKKNGLNTKDLEVREDAHAGGKYVFAVVKQKGRPTPDVLAEALPKLVESIKFEKSMRWLPASRRVGNDSGAAFSRPIRWFVALLGEQVIPFEYAGVTSGNTTRGLRPYDSPEIMIPSADKYFDAIREAGILLNKEERKSSIIEQVKQAAAVMGGEAIIEEGLLNEVANLVEMPTAVMGGFDKEFLSLPRDVLISVMKKHQRYFPVESPSPHGRGGRGEGKLLAHFIAIRNGDDIGIDLVRQGNEHVLGARFADANFFVREDLKQPLDAYRPGLSKLIFQTKLGSMLDKSDRMDRLVNDLIPMLGLESDETVFARRAVHLAKADLVTQMVTEMTSLQGIIGGEYALRSGEQKEVAEAIGEQYRTVPKSKIGLAVALTDRIDSLVGLFAAGLAPTGAKDPFGLRRAAIGTVQPLIEHNISFDLREAVRKAARLQPIKVSEEVQEQVLDFIAGRLRVVLNESGYRYDVVDAVLAEQSANPAAAAEAVKQLQVWVERKDWNSILPGFARCVRIIRSAKLDDRQWTVDDSKFVEQAERNLYQAIQSSAVDPQGDTSSRPLSIDEFLGVVVNLIPYINAFFDKVLVMAEDEKIKQNRLALVGQIANLSTGIADLSKLEGF
jgi:glycyl-tRNA synthetase